jgi:hypothetical protein
VALKKLGKDEYRSHFSFDLSGTPVSDKRNNALKVALDIRKFEIDLYWKRTTYFWAFIAATLVAYCESAKTIANPGDSAYFLQEIFSIAGLVFSFAWIKMNQGSKFWQENWEAHVDFLEDTIQGPLYKVISQRREDPQHFIDKFTRPQPFSVSKINQLISYFVFLIWCILLLVSVIHASPYLYGFAHNIWGHTLLRNIMSLMGAAFAVAICFGINRGGQSTFATDLNAQSDSEDKVQFYLRN